MMDFVHKTMAGTLLVRMLLLIFFLLSAFLFAALSPNLSQAQSETESSSQIDQFLQEADRNFEQKNFRISYQFYRNVLALDPLHQYARERLYDIAKIYQTLENVALEQQNQEQATLFYQEYRTIIRYVLSLLTNQLQHFLEQYAEYTRLDAPDEETREKIVEALKNILLILPDIQAIYEQFPQDDANSAQMIDRIKQTIDKYQQEYTRYESLKQQ